MPMSMRRTKPQYLGEDTISFPEDINYEALTDEEKRYMAEEREYLRNLRQNCMMEYESWNRYFGSIRNSIDYQVLDDNGSILMNYAKNRNILSDDDYVFRVVMHYDDQGRMDVMHWGRGHNISSERDSEVRRSRSHGRVLLGAVQP